MKPEEQRVISEDEFDVILNEIASDMTTASLLSIPGVYELVSEHLNNDVLTEHERRLVS